MTMCRSGRSRLLIAFCSAVLVRESVGQSALCVDHEGCRTAGLAGSCCPTNNGINLGCCDANTVVSPAPPLPPAWPSCYNVCYNTCRYSKDGDCDDGGAGAEFAACSAGTDCHDCGERCMAPPPSPPGSPPPPPLGPRGVCEGTFDVVLILDRSGSMRYRMSDMKELAKNLVAQLDLSVQRAGVVSFSSSARVDVALSTDINVLNSQIDALDDGGLTNINEALESGAITAGTATGTSRKKVLWILSDGKQSSRYGGDKDAIRTAQTVKADGTILFAVGLGTSSPGPTMWISWRSDTQSTAR